MKQFFILLTALFALSACSEAQVDSKKSDVINKVVSADEFKKLMKGDVNLIDVRTPSEYSGGKIGEAVNIDFYSADFKDKLSKLDKTKPTLVYCAVGGRSGKAAHVMKELGFKEVYDLRGGYRSWPF